MVDDNKGSLKRWRDEVDREARRTIAEHGKATIDGPVELTLTFYLTRPADHWGTGKNAGTIKASKLDEWPTKKPDVDKLVRAVMDALTTAGAYTDDARVVRLVVDKVYETLVNPPGVRVALVAY